MPTSRIEKEIAADTRSTNCHRERMKLSFALFDLEVAHTTFMTTDPVEKDYEDRLRDLHSALEKYWQYDEELTRFLQQAQTRDDATQAITSDPATNAAPPSPARIDLIKEFESINEADRRHGRHVGSAFGLLGSIGRLFGYQGRIVAAR